MPRTKGGPKTPQRRKRILKAAKGFWGGKHRLLRPATEAVDKARKYAYRDRRAKKRDFRGLWVVRIKCRRQGQRHLLQPIHGWTEEGRHRDQPQGAGRSGNC